MPETARDFSRHDLRAACDSPTPEELSAELRRVLDSPIFRNAPRHSRFLKFVVDKAIEGAASSIKEYSIALEVFDRPAGFDSAMDSTVRAEARRLRLRLQKYYEKDGAGDDLQFELPKGTYVPRIIRRAVQPALDAPKATLPFVVSGQASSRHTEPVWQHLLLKPAWRWALLALVILLVIAAYGSRLR